jgi:hypothetical protein
LYEEEYRGVHAERLMVFLAGIMNIHVTQGLVHELRDDGLVFTRKEVEKIHKEYYEYYSNKSLSARNKTMVDSNLVVSKAKTKNSLM